MRNSIADHIHTFSRCFRRAGVEYEVHVYGRRRDDGTWEGWLEFHPVVSGQPILRTAQETSQPTRHTLEYWATGIEPIYFEGAFTRALEHEHAG